MTPWPPCLRPAPGGCELLVHVAPNAARTACAGLHDGALRVRLAAPPIDGRANAALTRWLARSLDLAPRDVVFVSGETGRRKRLWLACDGAAVADWIASAAASGPGA
jgi:uncharacterized protein